MPRFFVTPGQIAGDTVLLTGRDAHHIARSLRMAAGEHITVCDTGTNREYDCELCYFKDEEQVGARIVGVRETGTEPPFRAALYQALPKGDKLDLIIQKSVECGVGEIIPFESAHCIMRAKPEAEEKKTERRRRIALEAAKQCGRGSIPSVIPTVSFDEALSGAVQADLPLFCYEGEGTRPLRQVLQSFLAENHSAMPSVSCMIGSEGGFSPAEAARAIGAGMIPVGLGRRILRTETASSFVLACLVYEWEL